MLDPQIAMSYRSPQFEDPMAQYERMQTLKSMLQQREQQEQLHEQAVQENQMKLQGMRQDIDDATAVRRIFDESEGDFEVAKPKLLKALGPRALPVLENFTKQQQAVANLNKTQAENARENISLFTNTIDEIAAAPPEVRNQAYQQRLKALISSGALDKESAAQLPTEWDDQLMSGFGSHLKQTQNDLELQIKRASAREAAAKVTIAEQAAAGTTPVTPYQRAQLEAQKSNVTETELALRAARGDAEAGKALGIMVQNRIKEAQGTAEAKTGGIGGAEALEVDPTSQSILAQTGLSMPAFLALTGQSSSLPRDAATRTRAFREAQTWANKKGVDISTIASRYKTYNEVLSKNISRMNNTKIMESELEGTIENLREVVQAKDLKKLRIANVVKIWAGQEVNDELAQQYAMHLYQLRNELAAYGAATQGRSGGDITLQDQREAENTIRNGIAIGSLKGLEEAVKNSTKKMGKIMQSSVDAANKSVWDLFGVGGGFKPSGAKKTDTDPMGIR